MRQADSCNAAYKKKGDFLKIFKILGDFLKIFKSLNTKKIMENHNDEF